MDGDGIMCDMRNEVQQAGLRSQSKEEKTGLIKTKGSRHPDGRGVNIDILQEKKKGSIQLGERTRDFN